MTYWFSCKNPCLPRGRAQRRWASMPHRGPKRKKSGLCLGGRLGGRLRGALFRSTYLFGWIALDDNRKTLGTFLDVFGQLVALWYDGQEPLQTLFQEAELHVLVATPQEEIDPDAVTLLEPRGGLGRFDVHIAFGRPDLDLRYLRFGGVRFRFYVLLPFLLLIFEFAIVGDFAHRGSGVGRYLDQVETHFLGFFDGFAGWQHAEILAFRPEAAHFQGADALIHARSRLIDLRCVLRESHW